MNTKVALRRKTILIIMDGVGINPSKKNNAVLEANTPRLDDYFSKHPHTTLQASGRAVGLPNGQMGNSDVGHLTIGCGTIIEQDLVRIDNAIEDGSFSQNFVLRTAIGDAKNNKRPIHLVGLVSDGGVHSHIRHLLALIKLCHDNQVAPLIHVIADGRDTSPKSLSTSLQKVLDALDEYGGKIATITGRFYAMDRDNRWERIQVAWNAIANKVGISATNPMQAIQNAYNRGETDEFIKPLVFPDAQAIQTGDSLIFFNFRKDRPRELTAALGMEDFKEFDRGVYTPIPVTCMTRYDKWMNMPVAFSVVHPPASLAKIISEAGFKQLHCAETEKYAHVTFFLNGGYETAHENEERILVNSPNVRTYDECPEMSAKEVADNVINALNKQQYEFIVVNFANGDMVGHTAIREAIIKAVEVLDTEVGRVLDAAVENNYSVVLTADHGNCDEYINPFTGEPNTQHTVYPVPCLIIDKSYWQLGTNEGLSNIAPTILQLMGLEKPKEMNRDSILIEELSLSHPKKLV